MKTAQIGNGFVGSALHKSFDLNGVKTKIYDKFQKIGSIRSVLDSDILFLCLPTPFVKGGGFDLSAIEENLLLLKENAYRGLCVVKSTVEVGTTKMLAEKYGLNIAHNPEFLTERTAFEDFHNQDHIVLGKSSDSELFNSLVLFYKDLYPNARVSICSSDESEAVKIFRNCFYAQKVMIFNEFYFLCNKLGVDYNRVRDLMLCDWLGEMHTMVPGPDGGIGYSGHCFPKDTEALLLQMKSNDSIHQVLEAAVSERNEIRPDMINIMDEKLKTIEED
ncbi:MAG TPA: UDP-glucose/GDP-mannose dehydrogenase family protein [Nitrospinaceae bacterium]|nr:UDP-glucose/GDP-mannose dehydrogenase family protein [Nitrospinaceae bacterium]